MLIFFGFFFGDFLNFVFIERFGGVGGFVFFVNIIIMIWVCFVIVGDVVLLFDLGSLSVDIFFLIWFSVFYDICVICLFFKFFIILCMFLIGNEVICVGRYLERDN